MNDTKLFLNGRVFAVAGASRERSKYGNMIFRAIGASGRKVFPLNPFAKELDGHRAFGSIRDLPSIPDSLSIVTPPEVTRQIVKQAILVGVKNLWMQPGAEDIQASDAARAAGINVIDDGSCILVILARERHVKQGADH